MMLAVVLELAKVRPTQMWSAILYAIGILPPPFLFISQFDRQLLWALFTQSFAFLFSFGNLCVYFAMSVLFLTGRDGGVWAEPPAAVLVSVTNIVVWCTALFVCIACDAFPSRLGYHFMMKVMLCLAVLNGSPGFSLSLFVLPLFFFFIFFKIFMGGSERWHSALCGEIAF